MRKRVPVLLLVFAGVLVPKARVALYAICSEGRFTSSIPTPALTSADRAHEEDNDGSNQ